MIGVTVLALVAVVWRLNGYHTEPATPVEIMMLSVLIAWLVSLEGTFGGTLVYDYRFNVDSAPDGRAVWRDSETDVFPGRHVNTGIPS